MLNDGMGQQRLQEAEQRRAVTGAQMTDVPRVDVSQEGQDVEMAVTHAVGNAESSGPQPVETRSKTEDVPVFRSHFGSSHFLF